MHDDKDQTGTTSIARQATNYRAPISVGEKLTLTIRYLATGESYTSLSCQFRVGRSTISKFLPEVCRAIQDEFTREYLRCPTTPDEWKKLETEFRIRWNVPHALEALDGKHAALKKPKNSGALYHNYKGLFSIATLALVDGQYKFRWADVGTAGSCSDAQIFNICHLKRKIDDGSIGFPDPAPITQGGRDVPYFILEDDAFALKIWLMKPCGRRMLTREERIANYRISRGRRVVENALNPMPNIIPANNRQTNPMPNIIPTNNKQTNRMPNISHPTKKQTDPVPNITC